MSPTLLLFLAANYTTYLGGSKADTPIAITVDYAGAIYVAGITNSPNFPVTSTTLGAPAAGHTCGFITKLNPEGTAPEFSICLTDVYITAFTMDPSGAMYLAAINPDNSQSVLKLDRNAQTILYTTPFQFSEITAIAADPYGLIYVAGSSNSLVTTTNAYQPQLAPGTCHTGAGVQLIPVPCNDAFVTKLSRDGTVIYSTYLGGSGPDTASAIATDSFGNAWLTGTTVSPNFPTTPTAIQTQFHGEIDLGPLRYGDAFLAELDPTGSTLLYSTYLGGSELDAGTAIATDGQGSVYVTGNTQSPNFPVTPGTLQTNFTGNPTTIPGSNLNGFLMKFDATAKLIYSTYLPGTSNSIAVNAQRQPLIAQSPLASFVAADGSSVVCSAPTYGGLLASNGTDSIYSTGITRTYLTSIATPGAFQQTYQGGDTDAVVQASAASLCFHAPAR